MSNNNNNSDNKKKVVINQHPQNIQHNKQSGQNKINTINTNLKNINAIKKEVVEEPIKVEKPVVEAVKEIVKEEIEITEAVEEKVEISEPVSVPSEPENEEQEQPEENIQQPPQTKEQFEHMYRVRLKWERPDTQIFSSPILEEAIKEASAHEGYKVFIDDDGCIEYDPWIPKEVEIKEESPLKEVIHPLPGHKIILNDTPVYRTANDKHPFKSFTGEYYFYDRTIVKGRAKITTHKRITSPDPSLIFGYIEIE